MMRRGSAAIAPLLLLLLLLLLHLPIVVHAQSSGVQDGRKPPVSPLERPVSVQFVDTPVRAALETVGERAGFRVAFSSDFVPSAARVTFEAASSPARDVLGRVLDGTPAEIVVATTELVIIRPRTGPDEHDGDAGHTPERAGSIAGRVTDAATGQAVASALVYVEGTAWRAVTAADGRYRLAGVRPGDHPLVVQRLGYAERRRTVTVVDGEESVVDIALELEPTLLEQIVATGTPFETRMRTVPNPISVITADEIEAKHATTITDLLRGEIPGLMALSPGQEDAFSYIYVRGRAGWATEDVINIYIDGVEVAHPTYISTIDPGSIERIEVVRGPQSSAVYGSEAASGVLQIFTKKGTNDGLDRPTITAQASAGVVESDYTPAGVSRPMTQDYTLGISGGSEPFSYRVGGSYVAVGEWLKNYDSKTLSFSGGLRAMQGPFTVELSALWSNRDLGYAMSPIFWNYPANPSCAFCGDRDAVDSHRTYALSQNTMGLTLSYQATPRWQHTLILGDDQNRNAYHEPEPRRLTPADTFVSLYQNEVRRRSIRYKTAYQTALGTAVAGRFTLGADYWAYDDQGSSGYDLLTAAGIVRTSAQTVATFTNDHSWNAGAFAMAELGFSDRLHLTLATRVEENSNLGEEYGRAVSPRAGISYVRGVGPLEVKLRAQYGKGVRPPPPFARAGRIIGTTVYQPNAAIGPEEKVGWDAGVELYWGGKASLAVTRYDEVGENLIQFVDIQLTPSRIRQYQNIGRVASEGWEVEGRANLGPLTLEANYAYADNTIEQLSNQYTENPNSTYQVGDRMEYVPRHSGGGTLTGRFWRGSASVNWSVIAGWRGLDVIPYYGSLYGGEPYRGSLRDYYIDYSDAHWKWNFLTEQELGQRLTAFLRVDNLTNQQKGDLVNLYVAQGRTTVVGLRYAF